MTVKETAGEDQEAAVFWMLSSLAIWAVVVMAEDPMAVAALEEVVLAEASAEVVLAAVEPEAVGNSTS